MPWQPSRRTVLGALAGALALPLSARGEATARHLVIVLADGGWDPTFALDPKPDNPAVHGPYLDLNLGDPDDREVTETIAGIPLATNAVKRPMVRTLFEAWGDRTTVVNGLWVGALNHPQGLRRVLTGAPAEGAPDLVTISGVTHGAVLPVGAVDLSGSGRFGVHAASTLRAGAGGQLRGLLDPAIRYDLPADSGATRPGFTPTEADRADLHAWLHQRAAAHADRLGPATGAAARLRDWEEAFGRAADLRAGGPELAAALGTGDRPSLLQRVDFAVDLLASGVSHSVVLGSNLHWDTHANSPIQHGSWNTLCTGLLRLMNSLDAAGLVDDTVVVVLSEMGRTPLRNPDNGTDHWPTTSAILLGAGVSRGRVCGGTDAALRALPIDLQSGELDQTGTVLRYDHLAAGILELVGVDHSQWLPGVIPFHGAAAGW